VKKEVWVMQRAKCERQEKKINSKVKIGLFPIQSN